MAAPLTAGASPTGVVVAVRHTTTYRFDPPARLGPHVLRLRPARHTSATVLSADVAVRGVAGVELRWSEHDGWWLGRLRAPRRVRTLVLDTRLRLSLRPTDGAGLVAALAHLDVTTEPSAPPMTVTDALAECSRLARAVTHERRDAPGVQPPATTVASGRGSCRDSAWALTTSLCGSGTTARYVTGYLLGVAGVAELRDGATAPADHAELHAWCELFVPDHGWVGLDPTTGAVTGEHHVPLASSHDPDLAVPVTGAHDADRVTFAVTYDVQREPRDAHASR